MLGHMASFIRNCSMFSGVAVHRDVSPATNERSSSFTPTASFGIVTVFPLSTLTGV